MKDSIVTLCYSSSLIMISDCNSSQSYLHGFQYSLNISQYLSRQFQLYSTLLSVFPFSSYSSISYTVNFSYTLHCLTSFHLSDTLLLAILLLLLKFLFLQFYPAKSLYQKLQFLLLLNFLFLQFYPAKPLYQNYNFFLEQFT